MNRFFLLPIILTSMISISAAKIKPVKVFILAGQSNMEGKGKIDPLLDHQIKDKETK
ncbi:MAG: sialate O-acetylesterase, partial [Limisphaerales bacterium]